MFKAGMLQLARANDLLQLIQANLFAHVELDQNQNRALQRSIDDRHHPDLVCGVSNGEGGFVLARHKSLFSQNPCRCSDGCRNVLKFNYLRRFTAAGVPTIVLLRPPRQQGLEPLVSLIAGLRLVFY